VLTRRPAFVVELVSSRLEAVVNEQQAALIRTAFSTIVRESEDLSCGVFNSRGQMIAQSVSGAPGHINAMATGVKHFLEAFAGALEPGDVLLTNDPWKTAGQINDITVVTPLFRRGLPVAYFASTCHAADIGGRILSAEAREIYEEGLRLPLLKFARAGVINDDLVAIIRENVRTPDETVGDIFAQAAANEVGARQLTRLLDELDLPDIDAVGDELIARSEQAMRRAIAALPDGRYEYSGYSDGVDGEPLLLTVALTISDDEITVDYAGSSPQTRHGINVVLNYTHAYTSFAFKAALAPDVPHNDGSFRPVTVTAPEGSILNCRPPAPVASRHVIGHLLPGVVFGALEQAMPGRLLAGGSEALWLTVWRGARDQSGEGFFTQTLFSAGGMGARPSKDGLNATGWPSSVGAVPAEVVETLTPLVQGERALRSDTGGAGRFRGGLGQVIRIGARTAGDWQVSALVDRIDHPAPGRNGGGSGAPGILASASGDPLPGKQLLTLAATDEVVLALPGGGGLGDPWARPTDAVLADVAAGYVSREAAAAVYGVVVDYVGEADALVRLPTDYVIDVDKTRVLRAGRSER
jgi:N-methylhydantoinase B